MKSFIHLLPAIVVYATSTLFLLVGELRAEIDYQVLQKEETLLDGFDISLKSAQLTFPQPMFVRLCYEETDSTGKTVFRSFRTLNFKSSRVTFRVAIIQEDPFDGRLLKYSIHSTDPNDSTRGGQIIKSMSGKYSSSFGHLKRENRFGYSFITQSWERGWEPGFVRLNNVFVETSRTPFDEE